MDITKLKNVEINFLGFSNYQGFNLNALTTNPEGLVEALLEKYNDGTLAEGSSFFEFEGITYLIDVDYNLQEIQIISAE